MSPGVDVHVVEFAGADLGDPRAVVGVLEVPPRLRTTTKVSGPRPSQAVGPSRANAIAQDTGIEVGGGIGRGALQPGQGVRQVGGDGEALSIKARAADGSVRSVLRALGRQRLGSVQILGQLGPGGLKVRRCRVDQPAPGLDRRAGGDQAATGLALSGKPTGRG